MSVLLREHIRKRRAEEDDDMMLFVLPALYLLSSSRVGENQQCHIPVGNVDEIVDLDDDDTEGDTSEGQQLEDDVESGRGNGEMFERRTGNLSREEEAQAAIGEPRTHQRRPAVVQKESKEPKKAKKGVNIESMMERYLEMRIKQVEDESAQLAREEDAQGVNFSITRCISLLNTMDVTTEQKVKAFDVFKSQENREIFVSACNEDEETAMMWLRSEIA